MTDSVLSGGRFHMDDAAINLYERALEGVTDIFEEASTVPVTKADILSKNDLEAARMDKYSVIPWRNLAAHYKLIKHKRAFEQFMPN